MGHKVWPPGVTLPEITEEKPTAFWQVLEKWEWMWMWDNLQWEGDDNWIAEVIRGGTCVAVTDGSYMGTLYSEIHLAAFVLECSNRSGRLWGSFPEKSRCACSYRGELVGLMAIHLILLVVNEVNKELMGYVHIYLDCLGVLNMVKNLPPSRIPTRCQHSDVLKNILVNCGNFPFDRYYLHVSAHQDDHHDLNSLPRPAQLNCVMDSLAKRAIWDLQATNLPAQ